MAEEVFTRNPQELGEKLWHLKNKRKFCNAAILVDDQRIPVHAEVLASFSKLFEETFENEKFSPKEVSFTDIDLNIMESLIEYCYKGKIKINKKNAIEMFQIASILQMTSIVDICAKYLKKILNTENSLQTWKMSTNFNHKMLKNDSLSFITENFEAVSNLQEFLELDYSDIKEILSLKLVTKSEQLIYEAIKKWINQYNSRADHTNDLLDYVKLERLPKNFLLSESQSNLCNMNGKCLQKFLIAIASQINEHSTNCPHSKSTLLVMGSYLDKPSKIVEIFDLNKQEWFKIDYNECGKNTYTAVFVDGKVMTVGGRSNNNIVNTAEYYDLKTGQTESIPPMKSRRYFSSLSKFNDHVYVFGGLYTSYLSTVEKWTPSTKTWQDVAPMKTGRCGTGAALLGDEIFVIGGNNGKYLAITEAYNPTTNTWRTCKAMHENRDSPAVAVVGDFLYAVGGQSSSYLKTAEKYDKTIDKWTNIHSLDIPKCGMVAGNLNGQLVITGGRGTNYVDLSIVEVYDEKNDKWKTIASLKNSRSWHCVLEIPWDLAEVALKRKS